LREYRLSFRKLAQEEGAIFIPAVLTGILTNPSMKSDFLHPNASGYKVIAERIYQAIKPYLENNGG
jgi:lysophospholipase L1-like esterase